MPDPLRVMPRGGILRMGHSPRNLCTLGRLPRFYPYRPVGLSDRRRWAGSCGNKEALWRGTATLLAGGLDAGGACRALCSGGGWRWRETWSSPGCLYRTNGIGSPSDTQPTASRPDRPLCCRNFDLIEARPLQGLDECPTLRPSNQCSGRRRWRYPVIVSLR